MHEYRRFIQSELDARGWRQADLVRKSGLSRQLVSQLVRDDRPHLGQMPDEETMAGLAKGFGIPVERIRTAAARSLVGYSDDGTALTITLSDVSTDALLNEIRRRIDDHPAHQPDTTPPATQPGAPRTTPRKKTKPTDLSKRRASREAEPEPLPEDISNAWAARGWNGFPPEDPGDQGVGEESQETTDE